MHKYGNFQEDFPVGSMDNVAEDVKAAADHFLLGVENLPGIFKVHFEFEMGLRNVPIATYKKVVNDLLLAANTLLVNSEASPENFPPLYNKCLQDLISRLTKEGADD